MRQIGRVEEGRISGSIGAAERAGDTRLLSGRRLGIVLSDHTDDDGATIFRRACVMGLEGIVSKRLTAPYRSGPSRDWLKVKTRIVRR
jgi:bifunctional non-homologous end joining protein LigD